LASRAEVQTVAALQTVNSNIAGNSQSLAWMWERIDAGLKQNFRVQANVQALLPELTQKVISGQSASFHRCTTTCWPLIKQLAFLSIEISRLGD
jgi:hypothetical protein